MFASRLLAGPRVALFGTDAISVATFDRLIKFVDRSDLMVVCPADRRSGRGQVVTQLPLYRRAQEEQIHIQPVPREVDFRMTGFQLNLPARPEEQTSDQSSDQSPNPVKFDLGIVVSFGYFIPSSVINSFRHCLNVHPSLLPRYRGASPIQHALLNNDKETGVSLIRVDPNALDVGGVVLQEKHPILPEDTFQTLAPRLAEIGADLVQQAVEQLDWLHSFEAAQSKVTIPASPQQLRAPKLSSAFSHIDFNESALAVWSRWRAGYGFMKMRTTFRSSNCLINHMRPIQDHTTIPEIGHEPGSFVYDHDSRQLIVRCGDSQCVTIGEVHLASKAKPVDAHTFYHGYCKDQPPSALRFGQ